MTPIQPLMGILAGMGPKSTAPFLEELIRQHQQITGAKNDSDFPPILTYSLPTPFYIGKPIEHTQMESTICQGLQYLEYCQVAFIGMPCNLAHIYFKKLQQAIRIPLLNMITATVNLIPGTSQKIAILATQTTIDAGLYQEELAHKNLTYAIHPEWQTLINQLIVQMKTEDTLTAPLQVWNTLSQMFEKAGIDTVLIACTDLSPLFKHILSPFTLLDSASCLAQAMVHHWLLQSTNKPPHP